MNGDVFLSEACNLTSAIGDELMEVRRMSRRRRALWLRANRAGITYERIAASCEVSESVVTREIRKARAETRSAALAERGSRHPNGTAVAASAR